MANDCGAGYRGCYIGCIFIENTYVGRDTGGKKTKIFAAGAGGEGVGADVGQTARGTVAEWRRQSWWLWWY